MLGILIISSGLVYGAVLSGDCTFVPTAQGCPTGSFWIGSADDTNNAMFFHPPFTDAYKICCPGAGLTNYYGPLCVGNKAAFKGDSSVGASGTHVEENIYPADSYLAPVCLTDLTSDIQGCTYATGNCDTANGYHCVIKLADTTNTHISSCQDTTSGYNLFACCKIQPSCVQTVPLQEPSACNAGQTCCDINVGGTMTQAYCSKGQYGTQYAQGHCCPSGQYYTVVRGVGTCARTSECGFGGTGQRCPYDPRTQYLQYLVTPGCMDSANGVSCCPNVDIYGGSGNYMIPIRYFDGQP